LPRCDEGIGVLEEVYDGALGDVAHARVCIFEIGDELGDVGFEGEALVFVHL
jgi:hypothetical protein